MLLKEKAAPDTKKTPSQNQKVPSTGTVESNLDKVLPVMMHLEIDTPSRYIEIEMAGTSFHLSPYKILNCCMWSQVFITVEELICQSEGYSSSSSRLSRLSTSIEEKLATTGFICLLIFSMDSPMYMAELKLRRRIIAIQEIERTKPASKKGSGMMMGPTPSSMLMAVKAALYLGCLKASLTRFTSSMLRIMCA